jgi:hypothetical protein
MELNGHLLAPAALPPGQRALSTHWIGDGLVPEPFWTLWSREAYRALAWHRNPAVQPIARRYTNRDIPAFINHYIDQI